MSALTSTSRNSPSLGGCGLSNGWWARGFFRHYNLPPYILEKLQLVTVSVNQMESDRTRWNLDNKDIFFAKSAYQYTPTSASDRATWSTMTILGFGVTYYI